MKIDGHVHVGAQYPPAQLVAQMDAWQIAKSVVFSFWGTGTENDAVGQAAAAFPDRLIPFCALDPRSPDAPEELERCYQMGFRGLKLHPVLSHVPLSSHLNDPLFERTRYERGVVIAHGTDDRENLPLEFLRMAQRFPDVPLIMAHSGYFWAWEQAIEVALEADNLFLEPSRVPYFETGRILARLGADKVIWGTDMPYCDYGTECKKIRHYLDEDGTARVMGGNLAALLGLEDEK